MTQRLEACRTLAVMINEDGEQTAAEVDFVVAAMLELGLAEDQLDQVQAVLKGGGDFSDALGKVTSKPLQKYLFRRIVTASLLLETLKHSKKFIDAAARAYGFTPAFVKEVSEWVAAGLEWEKRGEKLMAGKEQGEGLSEDELEAVAGGVTVSIASASLAYCGTQSVGSPSVNIASSSLAYCGSSQVFKRFRSE